MFHGIDFIVFVIYYDNEFADEWHNRYSGVFHVSKVLMEGTTGAFPDQAAKVSV